MTKQEAVEALRTQGIRNPSRQLVEDYMHIEQDQDWALELPDSAQEVRSEPSSRTEQEPTGARPHPSSESNLEPILRDRGELERPEGRRKAGRPRIQAPWFQAVATAMSDGTPLRQALAAVGISGLTARQIRALYRNRVLKEMRREARRKWEREWGIRRRTPTRRPKGCRGGDCLGLSEQLRRIL
jgi:hypothetical protein